MAEGVGSRIREGVKEREEVNEVVGDEEGLLGEGVGAEAAEGEGEESGGREDGE